MKRYKYLPLNRNRETLNYTTILEKALSNRIPKEFYSIGAYREEAVCIEKRNSKWIVYEAERGDRHNTKSYKDANKACYDLISRVSESTEEERQIKTLYKFYRTRSIKLPPIVPEVSYNKLKAISMVRNDAIVQRNKTIEVRIVINQDGQKIEQQIKQILPQNISKNIKVLVFAQGDKLKEAERAGADYVGGEEIIAKIQNENWFDFDAVIATPDMMNNVKRLDKVLRSRCLMPNYEAGTLTMDVSKAINKIKNGTIDCRRVNANTIYIPLGKASYTEKALQKNFDYVLKTIIATKPKTLKGRYIKGVALMSNEGPAIPVKVKTTEVG